MDDVQKLTMIEIYNFNTKQLRVVGTFEEPWFAAKDICDILGIVNTHNSLINIPDKWKGVCKINTIGRGEQDMSIVNEAGLYKMILRSNKPQAQPFQEWVCEEVLPGIRKKGEYVLTEYKEKIEKQKKEIEKKQLALEEAQKKEEKQKKEIENQKIENEKKQLALQKELEDKEKTIKKLQRQKQVVDGKYTVYLCTTDEKENSGIFTIGKATDLENRLKSYNDNKLHNFKMVKYICCKSAQMMSAVETILLTKMNPYKISTSRDVFQLPQGKDVAFFTQWYDYMNKFCEDIKDDIVLEKRTEEELIKQKKEIIAEMNRIYNLENKEELKIKNKIYRLKNKHIIKIKQHIRYQKNRQKLLPLYKNYRQTHQEQIKNYKIMYKAKNLEKLREGYRKFYRKNKEKILTKNKERYEKNKEKFLTKKKERYEKNKEKILIKCKLYRDTHKEIAKKANEKYKNSGKSKERITCECGDIISYGRKRTHLQTQKHKEKLGLVEKKVNKSLTVTCECGCDIAKHHLKRHLTTKKHQTKIEAKNNV